jgi:dual specificity tyrosine-phosphorylation-regulated kinase 2/3/4
MLGIDYGHPIDVWSLACVVAELFTGRTLFTGDDEARQLSEISKRLGPPPRSVIHESTNPDRRVDVSVLTALDDDDARACALTSNRKASVRSSVVVECGDTRFNSFLRQALRWDQTRRLTPERALTHIFLNRVALRRHPTEVTRP